MESINPDYADNVRRLFRQANFVQDLGLELRSMGPGWCETRLVLQRRHLQQDGWVHAGVLATTADHTAGGAGGTIIAAEETVVTVEFKINFLRPARGERLRCRASVLKPSRRLIVVESEVWQGSAAHQQTLCSKATVTLAVLAQAS